MSDHTKILLYGVFSEYNFGGPSLMHGVRQIVEGLHKEHEIVCYQSSPIVACAVEDMKFPVIQFPYTKLVPFMVDAIKVKMGMQTKLGDRATFWGHLLTSDIVANLNGICFCGNFKKSTSSLYGIIKATAGTFIINLVARNLFGKKSVKCTASYGPITTRFDRVSARFAARFIFDVMCAREHESERQMREVAGLKNAILVAPDMANMMPCNKIKQPGRDIGISVSHQIIRQWKSEKESYLKCIVQLIQHILKSSDRNVILIPNEVSPQCTYHDGHVACEIHGMLNLDPRISIVDVANMSSSDLKTIISQCGILVASRYHSCVAALSVDVPILVVGWHYKYDELLKLYGQEQWIMATNECTPTKLIDAYDRLLSCLVEMRSVILSKQVDVQKQVIESGKLMFIK
jgi:polysaccharide pyruvyl transferase WcaK-like protein